MAKNVPVVQQDSPPPPMTPRNLIALAVEKGAGVDQLERLMALQERYEANKARKAFNAAFADFKAEAVQIIKRTEVKDGPLKGKFHANLSDVVSATTPHLSKHGLTISWALTKDDKDWMEVSCTLRHVAGHSESVSMGAAPDTGPGRNAIQARGSAKSYLERYTATAILGLAPQDADNDGNTPTSKGMDDGAIADHLAAMEAAPDLPSLQAAYVAAYKAAQAAGDKAAERTIIRGKDARKKALAVAASA